MRTFSLRHVSKWVCCVLSLMLAGALLVPMGTAWGDDTSGDASSGATPMISNAHVQYDYNLNGGNYTRVLVWFELGESIDLSEPNTDISLEHYRTSADGAVTLVTTKNCSWSGYLNSYEGGSWQAANPGAETKYGPGAKGDTRYSAVVPAGIEISSAANGMGEKFGTIYGVPVAEDDVWTVVISVTNAGCTTYSTAVFSDGSDPVVVPVVSRPASGVDAAAVYNAETFAAPATMSAEIIPSTEESYQAANCAFSAAAQASPEGALKVEGFVLYDISFADAAGAPLQPNGAVALTLPLPEGTDASSSFVVYDLAEGALLPATVSEDRVVFSTTHFSQYALGWTSVLPAGATPLDPGTTTTPAASNALPATGDASLFLGIAALVTLIGAACAVGGAKHLRRVRAEK